MLCLEEVLLDKVFFSVFVKNTDSDLEDKPKLNVSGLVFFDLKDLQNKTEISPYKIEQKSMGSTTAISHGITNRLGGYTFLIENEESTEDEIKFSKEVSIVVYSTNTHLVGYDETEGFTFLKRSNSVFREPMDGKKTQDFVIDKDQSSWLRVPFFRDMHLIKNIVVGKDFLSFFERNRPVKGSINNSTIVYESSPDIIFYKRLKNNKYIYKKRDTKQLICGGLPSDENSIVFEDYNFYNATDDGSLIILKKDEKMWCATKQVDIGSNQKTYQVFSIENPDNQYRYFLGQNNQYILQLSKNSKIISLIDFSVSVDEILSTIENSKNVKEQPKQSILNVEKSSASKNNIKYDKSSDILKDSIKSNNFILNAFEGLKKRWRYFFGSALGIAGIYAGYKYFKNRTEKDVVTTK